MAPLLFQPGGAVDHWDGSVFAGNQTPIARSSSPELSHYTDWATRADLLTRDKGCHSVRCNPAGRASHHPTSTATVARVTIPQRSQCSAICNKNMKCSGRDASLWRRPLRGPHTRYEGPNPGQPMWDLSCPTATTGTGFPPSTLVFSCQYRYCSTRVRSSIHLFIHLSTPLYDLPVDSVVKQHAVFLDFRTSVFLCCVGFLILIFFFKSKPVTDSHTARRLITWLQAVITCVHAIFRWFVKNTAILKLFCVRYLDKNVTSLLCEIVRRWYWEI